MNMQDTVGSMFTRIRNALMAKHSHVTVPYAKLQHNIAALLVKKGYLAAVKIDGKNMHIALKYYQGKPVIETITRVSKPGIRIYSPAQKLPKVKDGLGIAIISTSLGIITDLEARHYNQGGEVIGYVA